MSDDRCSHAEAAFSTTNSFVGVLASSKSVSGISAFGTITSATVKRRYAAASRMSRPEVLQGLRALRRLGLRDAEPPNDV